MAVSGSRPAQPYSAGARSWIAPAVAYAAVLVAFWFAAQWFQIEARIGGHLPSGFASFALLLAPYWAFGFGAAGALDQVLSSRTARLLGPALLLVPYLVFALPRGEFVLRYAVALVLIPVLQTAIFEFFPPGGVRGSGAGLSWQDVAVLLLAGIPVEFRLLAGAWPHPGLSAMPKLLLVDATLHAFLVVRRVPGVGYDFRPRLRDLLVGAREWAFFAPLAIGIGLALHFLTFRPHAPNAWSVAVAWLVTFFFVAIPEELFFRGLLQNLLERRFAQGAASDARAQRAARLRALVLAAIIFGLSHFNKPLPFNGRYVLLASIAGIFYGRAWLDRRRLLSSAVTHTGVDVVWGIWFKL
ncbi:MAG: type II CAAX prenyl endopeptidase Rce1 family protein [Terriglobales bacterium]